jgi:hypothetical protein
MKPNVTLRSIGRFTITKNKVMSLTIIRIHTIQDIISICNTITITQHNLISLLLDQ